MVSKHDCLNPCVSQAIYGIEHYRLRVRTGPAVYITYQVNPYHTALPYSLTIPIQYKFLTFRTW